MRTKLLRALAHLKAASLHIEEARGILRGNGCYWSAGADAGQPADQNVGIFIGRVKERLADEIFDHVEAVDLP